MHQTLLNQCSEKTQNIIFLILVTIMYIALCAEADIYVPTFPEMIHYFAIIENKIQLILSINFAGLCITGLLVGPLSDSYGRRRILIIGLIIFVIGSLGCVLTHHFQLMLLWRLVQGIGASAPMVIGAAMVFDKYPTEKAAQLIGFLNSVISAAMAGAPILGAWISYIYHWRVNFVVIFALALISFLGTWLFVKETLPQDKRKPFSVITLRADYLKLLKSVQFIGYSLIVNFPFTAIVIYIANLSVILINHMQVDLATFSYYQATTMATFIIFSLLSTTFIKNRGIDFTKNCGGILASMGALGLLYTALKNNTSISCICLSMAFIAAGGGLMSGTFGAKALGVFPGMNGLSMALMTAIRQLFASSLVILSEILFDGTIGPVAWIISGYAAVCVVFYGVIVYKEKNERMVLKGN